MRRTSVFSFLLAVTILTRSACAEGFSFSYHDANVTGMAHVFDGGDPVFGGDSTDGPDDPIMNSAAVDFTQPGSFGATASGGGSSAVVILENQLLLDVDLDASYGPSLFPGGDNPGGMAEAELSSVIEFVMPLDEVLWEYDLSINQTGQFSGSVSVVFENVTLSEILLDLTSQSSAETTLSAQAGDLMRLTSIMTGSGDTGGPSGSRRYSPDFRMLLTIPEPATLTLLIPAAAALIARRR